MFFQPLPLLAGVVDEMELHGVSSHPRLLYVVQHMICLLNSVPAQVVLAQYTSLLIKAVPTQFIEVSLGDCSWCVGSCLVLL